MLCSGTVLETARFACKDKAAVAPYSLQRSIYFLEQSEVTCLLFGSINICAGTRSGSVYALNQGKLAIRIITPIMLRTFRWLEEAQDDAGIIL
jgi:hypothetical protein